MSSASSSTASLVSTTTVSSRAPLNATAPPKKDFQAAFASLQSSYGFAASVPAPAPVPAPVQKQKQKTRSTATPVSPSASPAQAKDFEAAFANLQSSYGFSGAVPVPIQKPQKQSTSGSFFSKLTRPASKTASAPASPAAKTKVRNVPRPSTHMIAL
ncbi:hypothetical protein FB451DRAFT_1270413 [Mycena latifolia]|nr:hypothetical protein FB451DRAFT_1270413 [Mycena latifolia]